MSKDYIAWVDVETTGLDPNKEALLEVACIITDKDLNIIDPVGFESIVLYSPDSVECMKEQVNDYVRQMHERSGLWDELPGGTPLSVVDEELQTYVLAHTPDAASVRMGGNSLRLDLNFTEKFLPKTYSQLSYRSIDVSTVQALFDWWGVENVKPMEGDADHRAMSDIRGSIEQLRILRERIKKSIVE